MKKLLVLCGWLAVGGVVGAQEPAAFQALCAAQADPADRAGALSVAGRDGWWFLTAELRHLGKGAFWGEAAARVSAARQPDQADPLPAILDFQRQLQARGIELLLVPVPPKAAIYPDELAVTPRLPAPGTRLDPRHAAFYSLLNQQGVPVLDLTPDFLMNRAAGGDALYCRQDSHWSGVACILAAQRIAARLRERAWLQAHPRQTFATETRRVAILGDLAPTNALHETLPLRFVGVQAGAALTPVADDRASPVLLLGDSHNLIFHAGGDMQAAGAGLADQLAAELGFAVDVLGVRGSGATPARLSLMRRAKADPAYLAGKKLVLWCFAAREFTESDGWRKLPLGAP